MPLLLSILGLTFIILGILLVIWLIIQVEYTVKFSWFKATATITAMSMLLGFGIQFILVSIYV